MKLDKLDMAKLSELEQDEIRKDPAMRMALALERIATAIEKLVPAPAFPPKVVIPEEPRFVVNPIHEEFCQNPKCVHYSLAPKKYTEEPHDKG